MQTIISLVSTIALFFSLNFGMKKVYYFVKIKALEKAHQGLPSLSSITQTLTGTKYEKIVTKSEK